ncbi:hypothetical protein BCR39DRAFT_555447 [Naematelia encephala]|uniref:DUF4185 domain-containing protein n=1 Tax=Naematelia encephala TaxID=71784 RepID=A0A1Y2ACE4_9TREE|nr:hypothetical protein BCR39DRAFT_555447 [Naematelia encephala]
MSFLLSILTAIAMVDARAVVRRDFVPTVNRTTLVGVVTDPHLDRDSCGSVKWGNRVLWTCRDTQYVTNGTVENFFSSSASYSDLNTDGSLPLVTPVPDEFFPSGDYPAALVLYGDNHNTSFFEVQSDECGDNQGGSCSDGSRFVIWPNYPPLITSESSSAIVAYNWIKKAQITSSFQLFQPDPPTSLYRVTSAPGGADSDTLPSVTLINEEFFAVDQWNYGNYGGIVVGGTAYLYAQNNAGDIALAKVATDSVEDSTQYSYYVDGSWIGSRPAINDTSASLNVTAGGQGTFYYSETWQSYVWIGPWSTAEHILSVPNGNSASIGSYTMQAHPEYSGPNEIYVTYTIQDTDHYETPLYLIQFN